MGGLFGGGGGGGGGGEATSAEAERLARIQGDIAQGIFSQTGGVRQLATDQAFQGLQSIGPLQTAAARNIPFNRINTSVDLGGFGEVDPRRDFTGVDTRINSSPVDDRLSTNAINFSPIDPLTTQDVTANPIFAALKSATEAQFSRARDSAIANSSRGGTLDANLGDLLSDLARAQTANFGAVGAEEIGRRERERALGLGLEERQQRLGLDVAGQNIATSQRERDVANEIARMNIGFDVGERDRESALDQTNITNLNAERAFRQQTDRGNIASRIGERNFGVGLAASNRDAAAQQAASRLAQGNQFSLGTSGQTLAGIGGATNALAQLGANQAAIAQANADREGAGKGALGSAIGSIGANALAPGAGSIFI